jgi:RNase P subunit RPR2
MDSDKRRRQFYKNTFKLCAACSSNRIHQRNVVEGCRPNGDVHGITVFRCLDCSWTTRFLFDDSSDVYYYETKGWLDPV